MSNMNERKEGNNLEEINKNKILNFGDLSYKQNQGIGFYKLEVGWDQAIIKCERCNERIKAKWKDGEWNLDKEGNEWKVYLRKAQVRKGDHGYYINSSIEFYCPKCDARHNLMIS